MKVEMVKDESVKDLVIDGLNWRYAVKKDDPGEKGFGRRPANARGRSNTCAIQHGPATV